MPRTLGVTYAPDPGPCGLGWHEEMNACAEVPCNLLRSVGLALATFKYRFSKNGIFPITRVIHAHYFQTQTIEKFTTSKVGKKNLSSHFSVPEITVANSVREIFLTSPGVCKYRRLYLLRDGTRLFCDLLPSLGSQSRTAFDVHPIHVSTGYFSGCAGNQALQNRLPQAPCSKGTARSWGVQHSYPRPHLPTPSYSFPPGSLLPASAAGTLRDGFPYHF